MSQREECLAEVAAASGELLVSDRCMRPEPLRGGRPGPGKLGGGCPLGPCTTAPSPQERQRKRKLREEQDVGAPESLQSLLRGRRMEAAEAVAAGPPAATSLPLSSLARTHAL